MKKKIQKIIIPIIIIILLLPIGYTLKVVIDTDYSDFKEIQTQKMSEPSNIFEICEQLDTITLDNFPYADYLQNINYTDLNSLDSNLTALDSLTKNKFVSRSILSNALTNQLKDMLATNNLDSLHYILNWADNIRIYSKFNKLEATFYISISNFWYSYVSKQIFEQNKKRGTKHSFKYRYLEQKCLENGFFSQEKKPITEKILYNVINNNWTYIFKRFWFSTSLVFKILFFTSIIIGISIFFMIIKCITKKTNKTDKL